MRLENFGKASLFFAVAAVSPPPEELPSAVGTPSLQRELPSTVGTASPQRATRRSWGHGRNRAQRVLHLDKCGLSAISFESCRSSLRGSPG